MLEDNGSFTLNEATDDRTRDEHWSQPELERPPMRRIQRNP
jgi:hypothetical protein